MRLSFTPCGGAPYTSAIEVIDEDTVKVDGEIYHVPPEIIHVTSHVPILSGKRDQAGVLTLEIQVRYREEDRGIFESGEIDWRQPRDYGVGVIEW